MTETHSWTVGAAPGNNVVVDEPTVSGQHCRLTRSNGEFVLEDLHSTNGTWVNDQQITCLTTVTPNDRITLGRSVPFPWPEIHTNLITSPADAPGILASSAAGSRPAGWLVIAAVGGVLLAIAMILGWAVSGSGTNPDGAAQTAAGAERAQSADHPQAPPLHTAGIEKKPEVPGTAAATGKANSDGTAGPVPFDPVRAPVNAPASLLPQDCVYSVIIEDGVGGQRYRLGTACAIAERQLVTSAAVVMAIDRLRDEFPAAFLISPTLEHGILITAQRLPAQYRTAFLEAHAAQEESDRLRTELEQRDQRSGETESEAETVDQLVEKLVQSEERRFQAVERQVFHDVGTLEVGRSLATFLPLAPVGPKTPIQARVQVVGMAFANNEPAIYPDQQLPAAVLEGRIKQHTFPEGTPDGPLRYVVGCDSLHARQNWIGSPVLDSRGRVIAVYSRLTPPVDLRKPPTGNLFDAATVQLLSTGSAAFVSP